MGLGGSVDLSPERLFAPWTGATGLVLAVSGGPDSVALMHLAAGWSSPVRPELFVASVDHGLRPGSGAETERVCRQADDLGLSAAVLHWTGPKPTRAIQERARAARYALLVAHARAVGASHLVTAHTLDDQAETLLFRLSRGSGLTGLAGMLPSMKRDGVGHFRPFLGVRKGVLLALCHREGWPYHQDPANIDPRFARARWRGLAPLLEREGLTPERLGQLALRAARAEEALQARAAVVEEACAVTVSSGVGFDMSRLGAEPEEIILRVLRRALVGVTGRENVRLERLEALVADLLAHHRSALPVRRTLHHCLVSLNPPGHLLVRQEATRRILSRAAPVHLPDQSSAAQALPDGLTLASTPRHHTLPT